VSAIPLIFTSGWASGINCYAVVLMLGLLGRFGHEPAVPPTLERWDVLAVAAVLFACQFVAGKIPYVDSAWDLVQTAAAAAVGGGASLVTHLAKTGIRLGVNASPEPVSNIIASVLEDLAVAGMVAFALLHPVPAAILAAVLLGLGLLATVLLARRIRRSWRNRRARRQQRRAARTASTVS
jgi:hypothetical protein